MKHEMKLVLGDDTNEIEERLIGRMYDYITQKTLLVESLAVVQLCGSLEVTNVIKTVFPIVQENMFSSLSQSEEFLQCKCISSTHFSPNLILSLTNTVHFMG